MVQDVLSHTGDRMKKAVEHFEQELVAVRTGRAHPGIVDGVLVTYYGAQTPIRQLATVQVPDATSIVIQPWDPKAIGDIEQAIRESDLGLQPTNDGRIVRLSIPPLTSDRRAEMVKLLHRMGEEARVALRAIRKEAWEEVQGQHKRSEITEDDKYRAEEQLNKVIDEYNSRIEEQVKHKESDILTV